MYFELLFVYGRRKESSLVWIANCPAPFVKNTIFLPFNIVNYCIKSVHHRWVGSFLGSPIHFIHLYVCLYLFIYLFFKILFYILTLQYCIGFAIYWNESAIGIHVFPILNPPPSSLPIPSLWVIPLHQPQASSIVYVFMPHGFRVFYLLLLCTSMYKWEVWASGFDFLFEIAYSCDSLLFWCQAHLLLHCLGFCINCVTW